jgi:hypothetical protein
MDARWTASRGENAVSETLWNAIEALSRMTIEELSAKHLELFDEASHSRHKQFLY